MTREVAYVSLFNYLNALLSSVRNMLNNISRHYTSCIWYLLSMFTRYVRLGVIAVNWYAASEQRRFKYAITLIY